MSRMHKVTEEEYKLLLKYKNKEEELYKEQLEYNREFSLKMNNLRLKQKEREKEFKESELKGGIIEKHPDFKNDTKPKFFIENDIDQLDLEIWQIKDSIKKIEEKKAEDDETKKYIR